MNVGLALLSGYLVLLAVVVVVHCLFLPHDNSGQADAEQVAAITKH